MHSLGVCHRSHKNQPIQYINQHYIFYFGNLRLSSRIKQGRQIMSGCNRRIKPDLVSGKDSHCGIFNIKSENGMKHLRKIFPDGNANCFNFCLFSTSGVHGTYQTIEDAEKEPGTAITFLIVQPRIVVLQYGNAYPKSQEDIEYLKRLRKSSKDIVNNHIG